MAGQINPLMCLLVVPRPKRLRLEPGLLCHFGSFVCVGWVPGGVALDRFPVLPCDIVTNELDQFGFGEGRRGEWM